MLFAESSKSMPDPIGPPRLTQTFGIVGESDWIGWHPMSSAPRDGTPILAWMPDHDEVIAIRWHEDLECWQLAGVSLALGSWGEPALWHQFPPGPDEREKTAPGEPEAAT